MASWSAIRRWLGLRSRGRGGRPGRCRPRFDCLEKRLVPATTLTEEHVDIAVDFFNDAWHPGVVNHDTFPQTFYAPGDVVLAVGAAAKTTESAALSFLGAGAGNDVWILPQSQNFNLLYMGFEAQRTPFNLLNSYLETDPRVNSTGPWIKVALKAVRGPGHFAVWNSSAFGAPIVWMSSFQGGLTAQDSVFVPASGHLHYSWGFTARGTYQVDFQASSFIGALNTPITSPIFTITFQVDTGGGNTGPNQPPVHSGPGNLTTAEDTPLIFTGGNRLTVADPDGGAGDLRTTVAVTAGSGGLTLATTNGLTAVSNNGGASVTLTGPLTALNAALNGLVYTPAANFHGPTTFTITTDDLGNTGTGGARTDTDTLTITVTSVNDAPVHTVPGAQNVPPNTSWIFANGSSNPITVADADAGTAAVQVTVSVTPGSGTLQLAGTSGLTVTGNNSALITLTGTLTAVNTALNGLFYRPGSFTGQTTLTITTNDQGNSGSGGPKSTTDTVAITVTPPTPNLPPVNTVPGTQTIPEDTPLTFATANGNRIAVADPDAGTADLKVTLTVTSGSLKLAATANLVVLGDNSNAVTLTGALAALNAALNGLVFTPAAEFSGPVTLSISTDDLGHTGSGGAKIDTDTVIINVSAVNDPPVNQVPGTQSVLVSSSLAFSPGAGNGISVSDADAGSNPLQVTLAVTLGTLTLGSTSGVTVSSDGTASVMLTGPQTAINAALNGLVFTAPASFLGSATLTVTTSDQGFSGPGGPKSDVDVVTLNVQLPNVGPVNTVPGALTTPEDTPLPLSGANAIQVADPDAGGNPVQVTVAVTPGAGTLSVGSPAGVTVSGDGTASLTLTGALASLNPALSAVVFTPTANLTNVVTATVLTSDLGNTGFGGALTVTDTFTITVTPVNDAPVHNLPGPQSTTRNKLLTFAAASNNRISIGDPDAAGQPVQTTLAVLHGTLTLAGTAGLTVAGDGTATVALTGTVADINAALNGLIYRPSPRYTGPDTLTLTSDDQGHSGAGCPQAITDQLGLFVRAKSGGIFVVAADVGGPGAVRVLDAATRRVRFALWPFGPGYRGGIRVATGDVNGDGVRDVIAAPGLGGGSRIRVYDGQSGRRLPGAIGRFRAFKGKTPTGVYVACGDVDHDGFDDVLVGAGAGRGRVAVFSGQTGALLQQFVAFSGRFGGGARVAAADVNGDGRADIVVGAGPGGAALVRVFDGNTAGRVVSFRVHPTSRRGVYVAAGDVNGDGLAEIVTGLGGAPQVAIRNGQTGKLLTRFNAFPAAVATPIPGQVLSYAHGVRVALADVNGDGKAEILAAAGPGHAPQVRIFRAMPAGLMDAFFAFAGGVPGGVFVG